MKRLEPIISLPQDVLRSCSTEVRALLSTEKYQYADNVVQQADMIEQAIIAGIRMHAPRYEPLRYEEDE